MKLSEAAVLIPEAPRPEHVKLAMLIPPLARAASRPGLPLSSLSLLMRPHPLSHSARVFTSSPLHRKDVHGQRPAPGSQQALQATKATKPVTDVQVPFYFKSIVDSMNIDFAAVGGTATTVAGSMIMACKLRRTMLHLSQHR